MFQTNGKWSQHSFPGQNIGTFGATVSGPARLLSPLLAKRRKLPYRAKPQLGQNTPDKPPQYPARGYLPPEVVAMHNEIRLSKEKRVQEVQNRLKVPLQEEFQGGFNSVRNISDTLQKKRYEISPGKGKIGYFQPPEKR